MKISIQTARFGFEFEFPRQKPRKPNPAQDGHDPYTGRKLSSAEQMAAQVLGSRGWQPFDAESR